MGIKKFFKRILQRQESSKQEVTFNYTNGVEFARSQGVKVGENCRCFSQYFGSEPYLISIGDHVTISEHVHFITHDGGVWVFREEAGVDYVRPIIVHRNCFIGMGAFILPGVVIGPNSVVGAGSVVTKSVPPDSVVAGIPARVVSTLEQYRHRLREGLLIHHLSREEKKKYLLKYFGTTVEEWLDKLDELKELKGKPNG